MWHTQYIPTREPKQELKVLKICSCRMLPVCTRYITGRHTGHTKRTRKMPLSVTALASESQKHLHDIYALLHHKGELYSSSADGKVKIWNEELQMKREFQAHQSVVYDIAIIGNTLYTCSNDGTVQAWDIETLQNKGTLLQCCDEISKLYVNNNKLYAGDDKGIVRMWENDEMKQVWNLVEEIKGLIVIDNMIYSVRDRDVVMTETGEKGRFSTKKTIEGSSPMCIVGDKLCFVTRKATSIVVIDSNKQSLFKELKEMPAHSMIINVLCGAGDSTLYSGSYDKQVKQWDLNTFTCTESCDAGECVNAIAVDSLGHIFAGGTNGFICRINKK